MICIGLMAAMVCFVLNQACDPPKGLGIGLFVAYLVFYTIAYVSEMSLKERVKKLEEKEKDDQT